MIFSVNFRSAYKKLAQEIRCPYNQLGLIYDYIKSNPEKRILIVIEGKPDNLARAIEQIEYVKAVANDYTVQCSDLKYCGDLLEQGYNAFVRFPVSNWETFTDLQDLGVSDIYIDGPICFQHDKIVAAKRNTKIRVSPTISNNSAIKKERSVQSFFILPQDLYLYEDMIDIIDFKTNSPEQEEGLVGVYNRGTFNFAINSLIPDLPIGIPNAAINRDFGFARLNCGQRCRVPGTPCHYCTSYIKVLGSMIDLIRNKEES